MPYRVENIVRKGEIACYKQFFPFLTMFSTAMYLYCVKMLHCVEMDELPFTHFYISTAQFH